MGKKSLVKKVGNKTGSGVLFVAACYVSMYILKEYSGSLVLVAIAAVLLLISAFLFLNALFSEKAKEWASTEETEMNTPSGEVGRGEFQLKITKHMKEMESTQKEMLEVLKKQNDLLQSQMENLEHELTMFSEKQVNQVKSIVRFNKENARQLAISERETLMHVMQELKKAIEDNAVGVSAEVAAASAEFTKQPVPAEAPVEETAVFEEISQEELFTVSDLPGDDEYNEPEMPAVPESEPVEEPVESVAVPEELPEAEVSDIEIPTEEIQVEEMPADDVLSFLDDLVLPEISEEPEAEPDAVQMMEPEVESEAEPEPQPVSEPEPEEDPLAGLSSDPNAMMSPEDIAKLLAAMGQ